MVIRGLARSCVVGGLALGASACGGSGDGGSPSGSGTALSDATVQSFEGVYQLEAITQNSTGCDAEGPSSFASEPEKKFVVVGGELFGQKYLTLISCIDDAACATKVATLRATSGGVSFSYSLILSEQFGSNELGGLSAGSGFRVNDLCTEREYTAHELTRNGAALRVESRVTRLGDIPPEDGFCVAEPAKERAEAAKLPCTEMRVLTGVKLGPLP